MLECPASFFWELLLYLIYRRPFEPARFLTITKKHYRTSGLIHIFCVCVSVCLSGCNSEISGTGRHRAKLLSLSWRALPGELCRLLLKLTGCLVWEEKPLDLFHKLSVKVFPSHYNDTILKNLGGFLEDFVHLLFPFVLFSSSSCTVCANIRHTKRLLC